MSAWEVAALNREADQVKRDWTMTDAERDHRLALIAANIIAAGGDASHLVAVTAKTRATRASRAASTRRKGN